MKNKTFKIKLPVTWSVCGVVEVEVEAKNLKEAVESAIEDFSSEIDEIPLPADNSYVDGSFELSTMDTDEIIIENKNISVTPNSDGFFINGKEYTKMQLEKIGNEVASLWGGSCYNVEVDYTTKSLQLECIEHGEKFATEISFSDLEKYEN